MSDADYWINSAIFLGTIFLAMGLVELGRRM